MGLTEGPYFSQRRGLYSVQFDRNNIPPTFVQMNNQTNFQRKVARTGGAVVDLTGDDVKEDKGKEESQWIQFYRPMTGTHFEVWYLVRR